VPDAADDLLAAAVLDQQPLDQLSSQAREALAALPELFPITVSAWEDVGAGACCGGGPAPSSFILTAWGRQPVQ
jgi:hypothetical protein